MKTEYSFRWMTVIDDILVTCDDPAWGEASNRTTREIMLNVQTLLVNGKELTERQVASISKNADVRLSRYDVPTGIRVKLTKNQRKAAAKTHGDLKKLADAKPTEFVTRAQFEAVKADYDDRVARLERQLSALREMVTALVEVELDKSSPESSPELEFPPKQPESSPFPSQFQPESSPCVFSETLEVNAGGLLVANSSPLREGNRRELTETASQAQLVVPSSRAPLIQLSSFKEERHLGNDSRAPEAAPIQPCAGFDGQHEARLNKQATKAQHSVIVYQGHGKTYGRVMLDGVHYRLQFMPYEKAHRTLWNNSVDRSWADALNATDGAYSASLGHKFGATVLYADSDLYAAGGPAKLNAMLLAFWQDDKLIEMRLAHADTIETFKQVKDAKAVFKGVVK